MHEKFWKLSWEIDVSDGEKRLTNLRKEFCWPCVGQCTYGPSVLAKAENVRPCKHSHVDSRTCFCQPFTSSAFLKIKSCFGQVWKKFSPHSAELLPSCCNCLKHCLRLAESNLIGPKCAVMFPDLARPHSNTFVWCFSARWNIFVALFHNMDLSWGIRSS